MPRDQINEIAAFLAVARERSFTKAAAQFGITPSALSHTVKGLEERLGVRLLSRTTRSVATTDAGERLQRRVGPLMEQIDVELDDLRALRERPAGTIRITCTDAVIETVFRPRLAAFLHRYPDIHVELSMDYAFTDIVGQKFDAGVRIGEALERDMVATRIGPDWRFSVVGSPAYFERRSPPATPHELGNHNCINMRLATARGVLRSGFRPPRSPGSPPPVDFCAGSSARPKAVTSTCVWRARLPSTRPCPCWGRQSMVSALATCRRKSLRPIWRRRN